MKKLTLGQMRVLLDAAQKELPHSRSPDTLKAAIVKLEKGIEDVLDANARARRGKEPKKRDEDMHQLPQQPAGR